MKLPRWISLVSVLMAFISAFVPSYPAFASAFSMSMAVNNTTSTSYTKMPFISDTGNDYLIGSGKMLPTGLDTRVYNSSGTSLPHMLADNNTLFVGDAPAHTSSLFTFTGGESTLPSLSIIPGYSGNITTYDDPTLELDRHFDISISGYFNTADNGSTKNILYKAGALKLNIPSVSTITFHALNADDSDNWTLSFNPVVSGIHTVRVNADGANVRLYIDGDIKDTESIMNFDGFYATGTSGYSINQDRLVGSANGLSWMITPITSTSKIYYNAMFSSNSTWVGSTDTGLTFNNAYPVAVTFNGNYVHLAYRKVNNTYYNRGLLNNDGTITWAGETDIGLTNIYGLPYAIAVDTSGYPYYVSSNSSFYVVNKSSTNNGTWTTAGGYPVAGSANFPDSMDIVQLPAGKMYASYRYGPGTNTYGIYYNGAAWGSPSLISSTFTYGSLIADALGNVYYVGIDSSYHIGLFKAAPAGAAWTSVNSDVFGVTSTSSRASLSYDTVSRQIFILLNEHTTNILAAGLYYKVYDPISGTLSSAVQASTFTSGTTDLGIATSVSEGSESRIIVMLGTDGGWGATFQVAFFYFPWEWNDNVNNWYWMQNNTMPYADNMSISVQGTQYLLYRPQTIIRGTTLPDVSLNNNDGVFNWGSSFLTVSTPALLTLPATNINTSSATLNGQLIDMAGQSSYSIYFDYGMTTSYGSTTSPIIMGAPQLFSANASGLVPNTTYHFRAVGVSTNITLYGGDLTFTTLAGEGGGTFQFGDGNARVFKSYLVTNDLLFTAEIVNTYTPYYPSQSPKEYFTVQLISTDNTTILAATPQRQWGDKPIGIYLNPTQAASITYGAGYYIRVQANFDDNVSIQYQLRHGVLPWENDWKGSDLTRLDDWCISVATNMQAYYHGAGYVTVLTDRELAITDAIGGYYTTGIPAIGQVRPNLFTTSQQSPLFNMGTINNTWDNATAWSASVGPSIAADAVIFGAPFGMTGRDMLAAFVALGMLGVVMTGAATTGGFGALGFFLISVPILWLGTYFKIVGVQYVMVLTIIFGILFVRQFWVKTT